MKVRISVTLDIDPEAWESVYGVSGGPAVRKDVQEWAFHTLQGAAQDNGVIRDPQ